MKGLLVFGRTGQVARALAELGPAAVYISRDKADLSKPGACADVIRQVSPSAIINAAAYTGVDRAEAERDAAFRVNADAPTEMAAAAAKMDIPFLHVSTDYVFNGSGQTPWREDDLADPLGVYGESKRAGEEGVAAGGGRWAVLRTSWVFSEHGSNFVKTMLRLGAERDELGIVADQTGGPTPAFDIAKALLTMAAGMQNDPSKGGLYHFSGAPDVSWADFAREIFEQSALTCRVRGIDTADYPTPAMRPRNSRLNCDRILQDFGIDRPDWRLGLRNVLKELGEAG